MREAARRAARLILRAETINDASVLETDLLCLLTPA